MRFFTVLLLFFFSASLSAQNKYATITGKVTDENDSPLKNVSIIILGKNNGIVTNDSGTFSLKVPAQKSLALIFSYTGLQSMQRNFLTVQKCPQSGSRPDRGIDLRRWLAGKTGSPSEAAQSLRETMEFVSGRWRSCAILRDIGLPDCG